MKSDKIKIAIADDHAVCRDGLTSILNPERYHIIGQVNISEFSMTGEKDRPILSSNPSQSQPPSTFAYGAYKNLKTAITDKNIKLTLKIHNPTQAFKITHLINVPQTYTNSYAHKDLNYEKI
jgi:hypothetical protein